MKNEGASRVMIVDFDVHHGQATQREFYDDPAVLYVSAHRYEHGRCWPHLRESDYDHAGRGEGAGFNVNVALNETGLSDGDYLAIFHQVVLPLGHEFRPDLVLVSAGFDAALGCPEGEMALSPAVYGHLVSSLTCLAGGKVAAVLEGGYFLESLAEGASMTLRALLGDPCLPLGRLEGPRASARDSVLNSLSVHRAHWQLLRVQEEYSISTYDADVDKDCHEPTLFFEGHAYAKDREANKAAYDPKHYYSKHSGEKHEEFVDLLARLRQRYAGQLGRPTTGRKKVALVYDSAMTKHCNLDEPGHPERPQRVVRIMETIKKYGLTKREDLMLIDSRRATKEEIRLCHDERHFEEMQSVPGQGRSEQRAIESKFESIYLNDDSFDSALLSCGCLLNMVDCVCNGDSLRGAAVIRPPGHHAEVDEACGFCIFNNVAIAAKYALNNHDLKRVLVLDWDVHHGNGIQNMFYDDDRVLYISLHRFDHATFFPRREDANFYFVGEGNAEGLNINIPWNGPGMGDAEYLLALYNVILPVCYQFDPELVLVSAGFDAARGDPLGQYKVSPEMYGVMTQQIMNLAGGRVIVALEGGYNLNSISLSMTMCVKALLGDPIPPIQKVEEVKPSAVQSIRDVIRVHSPYWSSLCFGRRLPDSFEDLRESLETNLRREPSPKKSTSYIPGEYGRHASSSCINTMSSARQKTEPHETDVGSSASPDKKVTTLTKELDNLAVADNSKEASVRTTATEYVPSEYGSSSLGSHLVNTFSDAHTPLKCEVTDAPKQSSGSVGEGNEEEEGKKSEKSEKSEAK